MTDQEKEKIALFRYGIISPLVSNIAISMSKKAFLRQLGEKEYLHPNVSNVKLSEERLFTLFESINNQ